MNQKLFWTKLERWICAHFALYCINYTQEDTLEEVFESRRKNYFFDNVP